MPTTETSEQDLDFVNFCERMHIPGPARSASHVMRAYEAHCQTARTYAMRPRETPSQRQLASRHTAKHYTDLANAGMTRADAEAAVRRAERESGLAEVRAAIPHTPWAAQDRQTRDDGARAFSKTSGSKLGREMVKLHAVGGVETTHSDLAATTFEVLIQQLALECKRKGQWQPGQNHRTVLETWYEVNYPSPRPSPGGASDRVLSEYNRQRQDKINAGMEEIRGWLRNPARLATLGT